MRRQMTCLRYAAALMVGLGVGWFGLPSAAQSGDSYKTRLSALPADAKTRPDLAGTGSVTATLSGTKLTVNGTFDGLKTNAVSAKLHNGVVAGVRGPAFADLTISKARGGCTRASPHARCVQDADGLGVDCPPERMDKHLGSGESATD